VHSLRPLAYVEVCADQRSQVYLVNYEKVGAGDAGTALARDFFTFRDIDDSDRQVRQLRAEGRRVRLTPVSRAELVGKLMQPAVRLL